MNPNDPPGGLWAWWDGRFYAVHLSPETKDLDHVNWFIQIGLPDFGPPFDAILRGRMLWDGLYDHYVLSYYGRQLLPNQVYNLVNSHFNKDQLPVVEKVAYDRWL